MKYFTDTVFIAFFLCSLMIYTSCEKESENEELISTFNSTESHNAGQDCLQCHKEGASGEGWFTMAGTVYDASLSNPFPNATIKLYSGSGNNPDPIYTLQGDSKGNFYTTDPISFNNVFVSVEAENDIRFMRAPLTSGACNSCHGNTVEEIWLSQ